MGTMGTMIRVDVGAEVFDTSKAIVRGWVKKGHDKKYSAPIRTD